MTQQRRTQQQRREATRARLIDATITTLVEHGYAATSTSRVLEVAGMSVGGMYRHFPTLLDLVVAAAEEVRKRQFDEFREGLSQLGVVEVEETIELLRAACRKPMNSAWYDLMVAARTHDELRDRMRPFTNSYYASILEFARSMPVADRWEPKAFAMLIFSLIHLLDGEAITAVVHEQTDLQHLRTVMLAALLRGEQLPGFLPPVLASGGA